MFAQGFIAAPSPLALRRFLPYVLAGMLAAAIMVGWNIAFAQEADPVETVSNDLGNLTTMVAAFLVFFMQAGFAFLGAGLIRAKSTVNYMTKSFMDFAIASLSFWAFGFALMMGTSAAGIVGSSNFFLADGMGSGGNWQVYVDWMFQMVFAGTAATIVAGAVAERTKTQAYFAYSFLIGALIYPIYGHWVWNGEGWLADLGALDYAGSGVVHAVGGFIALAGAAVVGARKGKFNADGSANDLRGHNVPFVIIGTFILFFGWFGFNINTGESIGLNAINTLLAGATGAVVALYIRLITSGKADILMACNGALAGLVGVTAPVAFIDPWAAVVIGALAAPIMMLSVSGLEKVFKIDDPVGAVSVHGTCGLWGLLALGIFANGNNGVTGLIGGDATLLLPQLLSMGVVLAWALGTGFAMFFLLKITMGVRLSEEEEEMGIDASEHGILAYPEDATQMSY